MMSKKGLRGSTVIVWGFLLVSGVSVFAAAASEELVPLDLKKGFDIGKVEADGAEVSISGQNVLGIKAAEGKVGRVTIKAPEGHWDVSRYMYLAMDLRNSGTSDVMVRCLIDNNGWVDGAIPVAAGQRKTLKVLLKRNSPPAWVKDKLFGMNGFPGGYVYIWEPIDMERVRELVIWVSGRKGGGVVEIDNIRATEAYELGMQKELKESFFPFIDEFGQYKHKDWPGKTGSVEELKAAEEEEAADLAKHPGPEDWDKYGGWSSGPKLEATGHFRVEKYKGKWWLVDPEGRLFWSHGITCVRSHNATAISDRKHYFAKLPEEGSALGKFYGTSSRAAHGYYKERGTPYKTYDFSRANLLRKYGEGWEERFSDIAHRRLRSWGMNTIGNWSEEAIYLERRTAYTATLGTRGGRAIEGVTGLWRKFPDPFDEGFGRGLREDLAKEKGKTTAEAWCIGYFVDNELTWQNDTYLAVGVLRSAAEQPAKKVFVEDLKAKYGTIEKLSSAWGMEFGGWEVFLERPVVPDREKAYSDLAAFNERIAEKYFGVIRDVIKAEAPDKLYLGCRFDFHFYPEGQKELEWVLRIAAKYCDVVSFNRYRFSADTLRLPDGIDKPVIIGEWHMGALDRGIFHTGLRSVASQAERGEAYESYVLGALDNRYLVGAHWFQYKDQATTGRSDGENYQIGFVDVCDRPYMETVAACREVGYDIYDNRTGN
jgi:hypothetical protein